MTPAEFVEQFGRARVSAILRTDSQRKAAEAMSAALRGGMKIVEFTLTIPGAYELIAEFSAREGVLVGAGTVLEVEQARRAVEAGASFLVSPVVDEAVIAAAAALGVAAMPGTHTPTEMFRAHRAGAQLCKLFPAPAGGPAWLRSVLGPLPFLKVVPTNGIDVDNLDQWFAAGAWAGGFVASLFGADVDAGNWSAIEARARAIVERAATPT
ncbi:bifunctional 4-hydroxy-2-oxoglutarate aldolase/2-dehydro-3-deoxy-phosphogluconate aldolase [Enhygromyxa salina]|uniref:bifunctional 4-hydroxy-2-oxoglutarate aldolase/2-dehydro-3-deoxy-phosphogluconate aldolase n=1 Tax=Enhygromyxa salina TaxID=215803 RepID=UPI0015E5ABB8|nr:bifunctional 4-hydroxy-2-oxoglutarate aldolase/2-dehydro-3-deoxy-phosphogluconate aldolase [Enhygromyxa salina]